MESLDALSWIRWSSSSEKFTSSMKYGVITLAQERCNVNFDFAYDLIIDQM